MSKNRLIAETVKVNLTDNAPTDLADSPVATLTPFETDIVSACTGFVTSFIGKLI